MKRLRSVINETNKKNSNLKKALRKYQKRAQRLKMVERPVSEEVKKAKEIMKKGEKEIEKELVFSESLVKGIQANMEKASTEQEKSQICQILATPLLKQNQVSNRISRIVSLHRYRRQIREKNTGKRSRLPNEQAKRLNDVTDFFSKDENTTQAPGKNDTVTFNKIKHQKR